MRRMNDVICLIFKDNETVNEIEKAIAYVTGNKLKSMAAGKIGYSPSEVGDLVVEAL